MNEPLKPCPDCERLLAWKKRRDKRITELRERVAKDREAILKVAEEIGARLNLCEATGRWSERRAWEQDLDILYGLISDLRRIAEGMGKDAQQVPG